MIAVEYIGKTGHNYFLYEEGGVLQILPWDYNLAAQAEDHSSFMDASGIWPPKGSS